MTVETYDDLKQYVGSKDDELTDAYLLGKYDGIKQGRADAIDECIRLAEESCYQSIDMLVSYFEELKE